MFYSIVFLFISGELQYEACRRQDGDGRAAAGDAGHLGLVHRDPGQGGGAGRGAEGDLPQQDRPGPAPGEEDQGDQELSDNVMIICPS